MWCFFADPVCPGFCEAQERGREAFVNGRQLRCENIVLGIESRNRWRRGDVEEQVLILTDRAWINLAAFSVLIFLSLSLFTAAAGAAPRVPSPTGPLLPPCTSPTTRLLLQRPQQPPPSHCRWPLTRTPPTASPLPCSPRRTPITPICSLLQRPCLHHRH